MEQLSPFFMSLMVALVGWVLVEQRALRRDVHRDSADLRERMARLEGLFEGFTRSDGKA